jgi:N-methylhydantoinase A
LIEAGRPSIATELEVRRVDRFRRGSGLPLKTSSVDLIEIGAGGGSIARIDQFGLIQVGPDSAGSSPGPACYGLGGEEPTVTDADLVLGYLDPDFFVGGRMSLDSSRANAALERLAKPLNVGVGLAAWAVHQTVNENMANAARIHAAERGRTLDVPLFAFGGAGPVHAYRVAKNLGMRQVISPLAAGVGSTIGLLAAPIAFDLVRTAVDRVSDLSWDIAVAVLDDMERSGLELLATSGIKSREIRLEWSADMRLAGQAYEITVELPGERPRPGDELRLEEAFFAKYSSLFDRTPPNVNVEVVSWRVRASGPDPAFSIGVKGKALGGAHAAMKGQRQAYFPEARGYTSTPVFDRYQLSPGDVFTGPAIVEERESTLVIGPGATASVDAVGNVRIEVPNE